MSRFRWIPNIRGPELPALLAVLIVAAIRAVVTQDLVFGDEVGYLNSGQGISNGSLPGFSGSATYVDLYFLLSKATSDPIGLYFAMRAVAAVSFVLVFGWQPAFWSDHCSLGLGRPLQSRCLWLTCGPG